VVTEAELEELLHDCPRIYHMAERGSWPSIRQHGLLSTTALLDRYGLNGEVRRTVESRRRPVSVILEADGIGRAVVRDQFPMDDKGLLRCLQDGIVPEVWYRRLNSKVFFWFTHDRLLRLLNAGNYKKLEHDVLVLDSLSLVGVYRERVWMCPMNSGCTKPYPHPRGERTFQRIPDYPYHYWRRRRRSGERAVELAVDYGVTDIEQHVERVVRMRGSDELATIFQR
jgi:hypothetical protein